MEDIVNQLNQNAAVKLITLQSIITCEEKNDEETLKIIKRMKKDHKEFEKIRKCLYGNFKYPQKIKDGQLNGIYNYFAQI